MNALSRVLALLAVLGSAICAQDRVIIIGVDGMDHALTRELMEAGDLLLFHSHLMHCSSDNESHQKRAAMVTHYGEAGTVDQSRERWGLVPPNVDWMPVRRHAPAQAKQA